MTTEKEWKCNKCGEIFSSPCDGKCYSGCGGKLVEQECTPCPDHIWEIIDQLDQRTLQLKCEDCDEERNAIVQEKGE